MEFMIEDSGWNSASETTGAGKKGLVEKDHQIKASRTRWEDRLR